MKGFFVAGKENQNAMKTHSFFLGIASKVLFYKVGRGEIRYQNSTQVIFFKKVFVLWKQDLVKKFAGELYSERELGIQPLLSKYRPVLFPFSHTLSTQVDAS